LFGHVDGGRNLKVLDHERDSDRWHPLLLLDLQADRQRLLDRRAAITAYAEAVLAADHSEADAKVSRAYLQGLHLLRAGERVARNVRENHAVELLKGGWIRR